MRSALFYGGHGDYESGCDSYQAEYIEGIGRVSTLIYFPGLEVAQRLTSLVASHGEALGSLQRTLSSVLLFR